MPELPDVVVYVESLRARLGGAALLGIRLANPFVLRTVSPSPADAAGKRVRGVRRLGKRIVVALDDEIFVVVHLMVAGRFRWKDAPEGGRAPLPKIPGKIGHAAFDFSPGTLFLTEASTRKRASIHLVRGEAAVRAFDRGGIEPLESDAASFREALVRENHTLKRALTDPKLLSGVGNAYSDEILHRAKLSPLKQTKQLSEEEIARLRAAARAVLEEWTERLREEVRAAGGAFPERVTAFRDGMAAHGRYGKPCPDCGAPIQRIVYAENETNYCARCQTGGRLLADRALSRLLKGDWPKTLEEMED